MATRDSATIENRGKEDSTIAKLTTGLKSLDPRKCIVEVWSVKTGRLLLPTKGEVRDGATG